MFVKLAIARGGRGLGGLEQKTAECLRYTQEKSLGGQREPQRLINFPLHSLVLAFLSNLSWGLEVHDAFPASHSSSRVSSFAYSILLGQSATWDPEIAPPLGHR